MLTYLLCGICANVASVLLLGSKGAGGAMMVSMGASGAVFGLFTVATLVKLQFNWKRMLEVREGVVCAMNAEGYGMRHI